MLSRQAIACQAPTMGTDIGTPRRLPRLVGACVATIEARALEKTETVGETFPVQWTAGTSGRGGARSIVFFRGIAVGIEAALGINLAGRSTGNEEENEAEGTRKRHDNALIAHGDTLPACQFKRLRVNLYEILRWRRWKSQSSSDIDHALRWSMYRVVLQ